MEKWKEGCKIGARNVNVTILLVFRWGDNEAQECGEGRD
jgi:hypothetical protein